MLSQRSRVVLWSCYCDCGNNWDLLDVTRRPFMRRDWSATDTEISESRRRWHVQAQIRREMFKTITNKWTDTTRARNLSDQEKDKKFAMSWHFKSKELVGSVRGRNVYNELKTKKYSSKHINKRRKVHNELSLQEDASYCRSNVISTVSLILTVYKISQCSLSVLLALRTSPFSELLSFRNSIKHIFFDWQYLLYHRYITTERYLQMSSRVVKILFQTFKVHKSCQHLVVNSIRRSRETEHSKSSAMDVIVSHKWDIKK